MELKFVMGNVMGIEAKVSGLDLSLPKYHLASAITIPKQDSDHPFV